MQPFTFRDDGSLHFELPQSSPFETFMRLKAWQGDDIESLTLKQVHKKEIRLVEEMAAQKEVMEGDGILLLQGPPVVASLRFADCVPVVICCSGKNNWLLGLHSGFRGTWQNIVASGIESARRHAGAFEMGQLSAWIGPSIGPCCYHRHMEGDDVTLKAIKDFVPEALHRHSDDLMTFDLPRQIKHQLMTQGVAPESIFTWPHCTACNSETYYSYRKGEQNKRMTLYLCRR